MSKKKKRIPTGTPGITQIEGERRYEVTLDYGRQLREDKKTGKMVLRQVKTTKIVNSMKEARALLGQNAKEKRLKKTTGVTGKVSLSDAADAYLEYYKADWSDSYLQQKKAQTKRMKAYFGDKDVRQIDTRDVEDFFKWCMEPHTGFPHALTANSVQKIKTHMMMMWKFMRKDRQRPLLRARRIPPRERKQGQPQILHRGRRLQNERILARRRLRDRHRKEQPARPNTAVHHDLRYGRHQRPL